MMPKLLIVDDDPNMIRLMGEVLRGMGALFFAADGQTALRLAREKLPDIVLLDAEMPGMDGFEVCAALKRDPATRDLTVIFVTAVTDVERETRALALGAVDFLHKPISPPIMQARVKNHLLLNQQAQGLKLLVKTDPLTGVLNRRGFEGIMDEEWRRGHRTGSSLAVVMIDIDHFKLYNDFYGHPAGDLCLRTIATVLRDSARRPGEAVARYGGEEFISLLPNTGDRGAETFGEILCRAVRALAIPHEKAPLGVVTASVGTAAAVPTAHSPAALITAADEALYAAKGNGRNCVFSKVA